MANRRKVIKVRNKLAWLMCMTFEMERCGGDVELEEAVGHLRNAQKSIEAWLARVPEYRLVKRGRRIAA